MNGLTFCWAVVKSGVMQRILSYTKRNWGRDAVAGLCVVFLLLSGLTLCFCVHEGECDTHPVSCEDVCVCDETTHDHLAVAQQDIVPNGKTPRVMPVVFVGDFWGFTVGVNFGGYRRLSGFRERERHDDHAVALVRLSRRLC